MAVVLNEDTQFLDTNGKPLVGGEIYIGDVDQDPVANPKTIYSDRELQTVLANPQPIDATGRAANKIWLAGRYSIQVNDRNGVQVFQDLDRGESDSSLGVVELTNVIQSPGNITAEGVPTITSYIDKMIYMFTPPFDTTGDATLNIDGVGARQIFKNNYSLLAAGDIAAGKNVAVVYNSREDNFHLLKDIPAIGGYIDGLRTARISATEISVTDGEAASDEASGQALMRLGQGLVGDYPKSISGVWQPGPGNFGLDAGTVAADTWYYVFVIMRPDLGPNFIGGGGVDLLFSASATNPTLPNLYTRKRRIGAFRTNASSEITDFTQFGNTFTWNTQIEEINVTNMGTASFPTTVTIPPLDGITWVGSGLLFDTTNVPGTNTSCLVRPNFANDVATTAANSQLVLIASSVGVGSSSQLNITTTQGIIHSRISRTSATLGLVLVTYGWIDDRGQNQ